LIAVTNEYALFKCEYVPSDDEAYIWVANGTPDNPKLEKHAASLAVEGAICAESIKLLSKIDTVRRRVTE
jgi:hypothetical protein